MLQCVLTEQRTEGQRKDIVLASKKKIHNSVRPAEQHQQLIKFRITLQMVFFFLSFFFIPFFSFSNTIQNVEKACLQKITPL